MANPPNTTADLILESIEIAALWSIQGNHESSLVDFETALFGTSIEVGDTLHNESLHLLRLWPHQSYLLATDQPLPPSVLDYDALMTDISDSFCEFRLGGEHAFDFLANYLSADLLEVEAESACLRCRLSHYTVILWWDDRRQLQLLLERSFAQSFGDYIETLIARWRPETP
jgi:sarcosine oxidase gamma subunit